MLRWFWLLGILLSGLQETIQTSGRQLWNRVRHMKVLPEPLQRSSSIPTQSLTVGVPREDFHKFLNRPMTDDEFGFPRAFPVTDMHGRRKYEVLPSWIFGKRNFLSKAFHSCTSCFRNVAGYEPVELVSILGRSRTSTVYEFFRDGTALAIKFNAYCGDPIVEPFDTILVEAYFLWKLRNTNIANRLVYYSASTDLPTWYDKIMDFDTSIDCAAGSARPDSRPVLRYLITEKVGRSLGQYLREMEIMGKIPFLDSIKLGIELLKLIHQLHSMNIIHGDLHPGNICEGSPRNAQNRQLHNIFNFLSALSFLNMMLIDFGRARVIEVDTDFPNGENSYLPGQAPIQVIDDSDGDNVIHEQYFIRRHLYSSPWESFGLRSSFRDDVFRALTIIAVMIYGENYALVIHSSCDDPDTKNEYFEYKWTRNIFDLEYEGHPFHIQHKHAHIANEIKHTFAEILKLVRKTQIAQKVDLETILDKLNRIISLYQLE